MSLVAGGSPGLRKAFGIVLLLATALIWVAASFISERLVSGSGAADAKSQVPPFFLTYLATTLFTLYIPLTYAKIWLMERAAQRARLQYQRLRSHLAADADGDHHCHTAAPVPAPAPALGGSAVAENQAVGAAEAADAAVADARASNSLARSAAAWSTPLWFAAQYTFTLSLAYTSVTSNTILSTASGLFTYGLSVAFLGERFTWNKLGMIVACMTGVILVTLADQQSDASGSSESGKTAGRSFFGDLLCIASSCLYAGYTTVMRRKLPDEHSAASVAGFLGYVGLFTALFLAPVVAIGIATGALPVTSIPRDAYGLIAAEGFLDYVLSDYLWAMAVIALGPTIATLGLSIQIPVAAFVDLLVHGRRDVPPAAAWTSRLGTLLILAGFVGINLVGGEPPGSHSAAASSAPSGSASGRASFEGGGGAERGRAGARRDAAGLAAGVEEGRARPRPRSRSMDGSSKRLLYHSPR